MNHKHLALIVVGLFAFLIIQGSLWIRGKRDATASSELKMASQEDNARQQLAVETANLARLQHSSRETIQFLDVWQPHFEAINTAQGAEVNFTMRIKNGNLVSLNQRYDQASLKAGSALPNALRAFVTFEDDYALLLNWLGSLEADMPTVRVDSMHLSKGTRPGDLRMELVLEQPLLKP